MPTCHVMQGPVGSGKTRCASALNVLTCSADKYFVGVDGTYNFNPAHLGAAHRECMRTFLTGVYSGIDVCVDNTNITLEELAPYVRVAQAMGYIVHVHTFVCSPETSARRNTHGVPLKACERMCKNLRIPPAWWDVEHTVTNTD